MAPTPENAIRAAKEPYKTEQVNDQGLPINTAMLPVLNHAKIEKVMWQVAAYGQWVEEHNNDVTQWITIHGRNDTIDQIIVNDMSALALKDLLIESTYYIPTSEPDVVLVHL
ncbi:uncharacterized protein ColSpa_02551 [Colletotrichum spaethianum]|uniref:Uncharacterized protein n=1 Tax=Colletotrichum spaethianum TaxID=700344 RepID=A0AA37LAF6_9PEZI|nr:uncharacterized protein ColSpa_02551 [Colletotrichum spaethianum]GKT42370.1 hypothetical protein ColSpa_02551 [Colletotrichum spaethianum]